VERGPPAADELDAVECDLGRVVQVVDDDDIVVVLEERERREGANVAGATVEKETIRSQQSDNCHSQRLEWLNAPWCWRSFWRRLCLEGLKGGLAYPVTRTVPTTMVADVCLKEETGEKGSIGSCVVAE
jgi:hypothetical protein